MTNPVATLPLSGEFCGVWLPCRAYYSGSQTSVSKSSTSFDNKNGGETESLLLVSYLLHCPFLVPICPACRTKVQWTSNTLGLSRELQAWALSSTKTTDNFPGESNTTSTQPIAECTDCSIQYRRISHLNFRYKLWGRVVVNDAVYSVVALGTQLNAIFSCSPERFCADYIAYSSKRGMEALELAYQLVNIKLAGGSWLFRCLQDKVIGPQVSTRGHTTLVELGKPLYPLYPLSYYSFVHSTYTSDPGGHSYDESKSPTAADQKGKQSVSHFARDAENDTFIDCDQLDLIWTEIEEWSGPYWDILRQDPVDGVPLTSFDTTLKVSNPLPSESKMPQDTLSSQKLTAPELLAAQISRVTLNDSIDTSCPVDIVSSQDYLDDDTLEQMVSLVDKLDLGNQNTDPEFQVSLGAPKGTSSSLITIATHHHPVPAATSHPSVSNASAEILPADPKPYPCATPKGSALLGNFAFNTASTPPSKLNFKPKRSQYPIGRVPHKDSFAR
ncbi:hypothetical protein IWQ62_001069 [Dispira parvispora]|uniref:Uncharacterized protein n=1 Tax=Dispira parvispora TaxID=1520584 RepID=A0A9W8AVV7_9FUNG|nr:hypothetical protein IWQ62_001069 [Dispira parvispora]